MIEKRILENLTAKEIKDMISADKTSIEELNASALRKLMNYEIDLLCVGDGDLDLICKCSDLLTNLETSPISNEEFMGIIEKTQKKYVTISKDKVYRKTTKNHSILKRVVIIAAAVLIITTTTVGVASAFGIDILEELYKISLLEDGAKKDIDGFTFYHGSEAKYYSSIEEVVKEKKWNILYPTKFPENVNVERVLLDKSPMTNEHIHIITNNKSISLSVEKNVPQNNWNENELEENDLIYETNGIKCLIFPYDGIYNASFYYKGDYYSIQADSYENLILLIDNLNVITETGFSEEELMEAEIKLEASENVKTKTVFENGKIFISVLSGDMDSINTYIIK